MIVQKSIEKKLNNAFYPTNLQVSNESAGHNVPANSETHFKVIIVSDVFVGLNQVQRQQQVYKVLKDELTNGVHALSMQTFTLEEWQQGPTIPQSPRCLGGGEK